MWQLSPRKPRLIKCIQKSQNPKGLGNGSLYQEEYHTSHANKHLMKNQSPNHI